MELADRVSPLMLTGLELSQEGQEAHPSTDGKPEAMAISWLS